MTKHADAPAPVDLSTPGAPATVPAALEPGPNAEITWLLHRAAQRMRAVTGVQAEQHGIGLRDYIVLSALHKGPGLTQIELGKTLGLDKTTLTSQLDRLERAGLVERRNDPRDRRARIPAITAQGETQHAAVAAACAQAEASALRDFRDEQIKLLRHILVTIIGSNDDPGSCI